MFKLTRNRDDQPSSAAGMSLPLLPLRDIVVFPSMVVPLFVGRDKSVTALEKAMSTDKKIFLSAQTKAKTDEPAESDIYRVGTVANILQILKLPDGTVKVLVEGEFRGRIQHFLPNAEYFQVQLEVLKDEGKDNAETEALRRNLRTAFEQYPSTTRRSPRRSSNPRPPSTMPPSSRTPSPPTCPSRST